MVGEMKRWVEVPEKLSVTELAQAFTELDDDAQAKFFVEVTNIAATWSAEDWQHNQEMQWFFVGRHLRDCECSTEAAREMVCEIARACREPK